MISELEKAKAFIVDKNNSLTETSKNLNMPLSTLKAYRAEPDKLKTAAWKRVHLLAGEYDVKHQAKE